MCCLEAGVYVQDNDNKLAIILRSVYFIWCLTKSLITETRTIVHYEKWVLLISLPGQLAQTRRASSQAGPVLNLLTGMHSIASLCTLTFDKLNLYYNFYEWLSFSLPTRQKYFDFNNGFSIAAHSGNCTWCDSSSTH